MPLVALTAALGYVFQERGQVMLREELSREGRAIARLSSIAAEDYLRDRQIADLQRLMDGITGYERVLGLRLFDRDGNITYQSDTLRGVPFQHGAQLRRVLETGEPAEFRRTIAGLPALGFIFPLVGEKGGTLGAIQVIQLESYMLEDARANRDFILSLSLAMVLATVAIVSLITRFSIARPIEQLVHRFREVGSGELPGRVEAGGNDELGRLAAEFNGMRDRLENAQRSLRAEQEQRRRTEARLRNAERLVGLGRLASGLAHEIGTPLNVISGRTESVLRTAAGQQAIERPLRIIASQIERITRTVRDMLDFARVKVPRRAPTNVEAALRTVLDLIEDRLERQGAVLELDLDPALPTIPADPDRLQQVFLNLGLNALDAMPEGGRLRVSARETRAPHPERGGEPARFVAVEFEDSGVGIPAEALGHVFDPFYTTKAPGYGTGLGLSVSYGIVQEHGGWFDLSSEVGRGTRIVVALPVEPADDGAGEPGADPARAEGGA